MNKHMRTKEQIVLNDGSVLDFILDYGDRKNMYLCIRDNQVVLKIPTRESKEKALSFLLSKTHWIKKNLDKPETNYGFITYENGETITLLGQVYTLKYEKSEKYFKPYFNGNNIAVAVNETPDNERIKTTIDKLLAEFAKAEITKAFERLCKTTELYPKAVTVRSMKSRWGSCSSEGKITVNFNIIYHNPECLDYVVIHELCHLKYMNHSKDFWNLVEKYCPDRKRIRKELNDK